jgi:hypothetical protein
VALLAKFAEDAPWDAKGCADFDATHFDDAANVAFEIERSMFLGILPRGYAVSLEAVFLPREYAVSLESALVACAGWRLPNVASASIAAPRVGGPSACEVLIATNPLVLIDP